LEKLVSETNFCRLHFREIGL
jgi:hypothetical protein